MMFLSYMITIALFKSVNKHCKNIDYPYFISVQYFYISSSMSITMLSGNKVKHTNAFNFSIKINSFKPSTSLQKSH